MRILVYHGALRNLGDTAMLESAVAQLLRVTEDATLCVPDRPGLQTRVWSWDRVERTAEAAGAALKRCPNTHRIPYLWRYHRELGAFYMRCSHALLDRFIDPLDIPLDGPGTLEDYCDDFDALHLVGGGSLTDTFQNDLWQRCCLVHAFAAQQKPVVLTGQQLGPFRSRVTEHSLGRALRKAAFVGVREPAGSLDVCRRARLVEGRFNVMGDDSLGLQAAPDAEVDALLGRYGLKAGAFLAVNLRMASYSAMKAGELERKRELVAALADRYALPVVVVPIAFNEEDSDVVAGRRLAEAVANGRVHVLDGSGLTPALVKGVLGRAWAAVGVSYHFALFALCQGVPAVSLYANDYYGQKAQGLGRFWGDDRLALPLTQHTGELVDRLAAVFEDAELRPALRLRAAAAARHWAAVFETQVRAALLARQPVGVPG